MKKSLFFGFYLFILVLYSFAQVQQLAIAVSPFQERNGHTREEADIITELFITQLVSSNSAKVVDRNNFDRIMNEMRFQASDWADNNKVARLGAALNADSIITGQLMRLGNQTIITANLLDIKTAQIISSSRMQLGSLDQVFNQMPGFVNELIKNLPKPNPLIGKWKSGSLVLEIKADGTFSVDNWRYTDTHIDRNQYMDSRRTEAYNLRVRGKYIIRENRNKTISMLYDVNGTCTKKDDTTFTRLRDRKDNRHTETTENIVWKNEVDYEYSINADGVLFIRGFLVGNKVYYAGGSGDTFEYYQYFNRATEW